MKLALALALTLAACGGSDGDPTLTVLAPDNLAELVPGGSLEIAWERTGDDTTRVEVEALSIPAGASFSLGAFGGSETSFDWDGTHGDREPVPPGAYDLELRLVDDTTEYDRGTRNVMVHGVRVTDPASGEELAVSAPFEIGVTVATMRPMELSFSLGDLEVATLAVPGEFVAHAHDVAFDGTDVDGNAVPPGTYTVFVDAADPDSDLAYRVEGGEIVWGP